MTDLPAPSQIVVQLAGDGEAEPFDPLTPVGERPFLAYLLWHARRFGFGRVLLLAAERSERLMAFAADKQWTYDLTVEIASDARPFGSGGRLRNVINRLDRSVLWMRGDTVFDFNWLDLHALSREHPVSDVAVALPQRSGPGAVCLIRRNIVSTFSEQSSIERDLLPTYANDGRYVSRVQSGFFLDIGAPGALEAAQTRLPASLTRGAVFFDRDGVINVNHGYVHRWDQFDWIEGAAAAIKTVNDRNLFAFLVTNQSGVARGYYDEAAVDDLHARLRSALRDQGAHLDDIRYCPHLPDATITRYASVCDCRKPAPGMILDLAAQWPVDMSQSRLIGDSASDIQAATAAGLPGTFYKGGDLNQLVRGLVDE